MNIGWALSWPSGYKLAPPLRLQLRRRKSGTSRAKNAREMGHPACLRETSRDGDAFHPPKASPSRNCISGKPPTLQTISITLVPLRYGTFWRRDICARPEPRPMHLPSIHAIDQNSGKGRQQECWNLAGETHQSQQQRRPCKSIDQPAGGDASHPGADQRNALTSKEEFEVAMAERPPSIREALQKILSRSD